MSLYRRILQDLDIIEADVERFCGSSTYNFESRIESLRHGLMYIIPYWDSRLGGTYSLRQIEDFKDGNEFVDYWLQKVECSTKSSCEGDECLWHTADYFYSSSYLQEWENDWVKCVEGVLENLESVQHVDEVTLSMSDKFRTIKQGLGLLLYFYKSMTNWNLKNLKKIWPVTHDMSRRMRDYAQRAMRIFKLLPLTNVDGKSDISTLAEEIAKYVSEWQENRYDIHPILYMEDPCGPEYETLVCVTDDLRYLVVKLMVYVSYNKRSDIVDHMNDIQCALSPTWTKKFVESGISYAIARDIYTLVDEVSQISDPGKYFTVYSKMKISHIRDVAWKIYMKYNLTPTCIDDFFTCARLILGDSVLRNTRAARYLRDLSLLHTFIKDTGNMLQLSMKLQDATLVTLLTQTNLQIQLISCDAWMRLWSLFLRKLNSKKEFTTLSLDIFKDITAKMPHPSDLLVDLIKYLVQMPKANELLHELRRSLVTAEDDNLFVKLVYSLEINLVKILKTEGVVDVVEDVEDVEIEVIEAAHNYILFFRQFKYDARFSLKEGVKGFNASLRHAYDEYIKFPCMELPMFELEFFDLLVNLTEFKESDTYNPDQIGVLHDDLSICFSFLQPYIMRHDKPEEVNLLWTQFTKLGRKVSNVIDTFEEFPTWYNKLRAFYVSEEVKLIKENLSKISSRDTSKTEVEGSGARTQNHMEKGHTTEHSKVEDRLEEEDRLRAQLTTGSRSLEKISIVGMPGLGKTTLAMSLYKDCAKSFNAHAWCYVGQDFQRKELLQNIIGQISERPSSEINAMKDEDLATLLKQCLRQKRNYLIVLDDVWDVAAWDALCKSFPTCDNGGKILITSRSNIVGEKICGYRNLANVIKLNLLTPDKSWNLLQKTVFGTRRYPKRLHEVGKGIAEKCGGLPLSIVVIAGVLKNKNETEDDWKEIERSLDDHLLYGGSSTLELSYRHLSVGMKQCFLYCAAFSKGTEIHRSKLIRLLLAERFVETSYEQESLESAAEKYLRDLVDRSLLMVAKRGSDHRIQTCRIHDLLLDFCIQKAKAEKFLITMDRWDDPACRQIRGRLYATEDQVVKFNFEGSTQLKLRSLICFPSYKVWKSVEIAFENFKSLTLLDLERLHMLECFPASIGELTLLRYLSLRGHMKSIPSSISRLVNLETLIVRGTRGEVEVPHTIFSLSKLRDLLVDKRARIGVHPSNDNSLSSLRNFSTPVLSGSIADQIILRLPNLRKLRCIILEKTFNWSILDRLCHLESLRVFYQSWSPFCGKFKFPSNLYKLTLSGFKLPWLDIEKIADMLPRLEILKLLLRAFEGEKWSTTATFENLKYLRMEGLNIKSWEASDDNFPRLERLVVRRCKSLDKIPEEFGNMGELMGIEAHWCEASLGKSVLKIKREQIDGGNMKFEAIIYPTVFDLSDDEELSE
ncbi:putative late blight resistance protein homolog R1B-23 [Silene latifolia]|uniref:putative late blight resistance protein homolog R1B-23 n=1 Tax=Silene latifolia TaxID=37657 RepID=UPI003D7740E9